MRWLQVEMSTNDSMKVKELSENYLGVAAPVKEQELYDGDGGS